MKSRKNIALRLGKRKQQLYKRKSLKRKASLRMRIKALERKLAE